jgi:hypothetical protein
MKWKPHASLHSGNVLLLWASPLVHFEEEVIMNINICRSQGPGKVGFFHLLLKSGRDLAPNYTCNFLIQHVEDCSYLSKEENNFIETIVQWHFS